MLGLLPNHLVTVVKPNPWRTNQVSADERRFILGLAQGCKLARPIVRFNLAVNWVWVGQFGKQAQKKSLADRFQDSFGGAVQAKVESLQIAGPYVLLFCILAL